MRSQEPQVGASISANQWEDKPKYMLLEAVKSLYEDRIMPHHMLVLRRIQEMYDERWSSQQLQRLCLAIPEIKLVGEGDVKRYDIMLHDHPGSEEFVDQLSPEDPYPPEVWLEVKTFLEDEAQKPEAGWPGSRYEFAKWIHSRLYCLSNYSLGHICHLVQMCVSKKELLGYRFGNLVPYQHSDDYKKKSNAVRNIPTQILPGERYVQTWEQAGEVLAQLLEQNGGSVKLSTLKKMCRDECHVELSESALGHAKLSEFLRDNRLKSPSGGSFDLEQQGTSNMVVHREPTCEWMFRNMSTVPIEDSQPWHISEELANIVVKECGAVPAPTGTPQKIAIGISKASQKKKGNKMSAPHSGKKSPSTPISIDSDSKSTAASDDDSPKIQFQQSPCFSPSAAPELLPPPGLEMYDPAVESASAQEAFPPDTVLMQAVHDDMRELYILDTMLRSFYASSSLLPLHGHYGSQM